MELYKIQKDNYTVMIKIVGFIFILLVANGSAIAQYHFPEKGRIIFERKVNTHAVLPRFVSEAGMASKAEVRDNVHNYMLKNPQFWNDSFQLSFEEDKTYFEPLFVPGMQGIGISVSYANKVYTDFTKATVFAEKHVFNEVMQVKDVLRKIKWKLTDETREIAGYECRRANALIMDSVYVVAFYTDAIKTKGGPEYFNGLPGMILGVALPHYHISYFASRVEISAAHLPVPGFKSNAVSHTVFNATVLNYLSKHDRLNSWTRVFMDL